MTVSIDATVAPPRPSMRLIVRCVAEAFDIDEGTIYAHRRHQAAVDARFAIYWLARKLTTLSFPVIGRELGGRDHTTILYGIAACEKRRTEDEAFRAKLDGALLAVKRLAISGEASRFADVDPIKVAERIIGSDAGRGHLATRVSTIEVVAICTRMLDLEDLAASAFQLLLHLDELVDLRRARTLAPPPSAREAALLGNARMLINALTKTLAELGYAPEPGTEQETATPQQEAIHATAATPAE